MKNATPAASTQPHTLQGPLARPWELLQLNVFGEKLIWICVKNFETYVKMLWPIKHNRCLPSWHSHRSTVQIRGRSRRHIEKSKMAPMGYKSECKTHTWADFKKKRPTDATKLLMAGDWERFSSPCCTNQPFSCGSMRNCWALGLWCSALIGMRQLSSFSFKSI